MKFITAFIVAFFLTMSVTTLTSAEELPVQNTLPQIHGEAAYLIDVQTGQTLFMKNQDKPLAPASTTKIMTGLLAFEHGNLDDVVTASSTLLNNKIVYGTQIYLQPGEKMPLRDLLYAMLLNSANDAAVTIAEYIGGDLPHFVDMMNQRAHEIGANQTHFLNPSGLTESGHVTTAHDLALIARAAYQNPLFAQYVRTKTHSISRVKPDVPTQMINENKLLWRDPSVDGIKTGYTAAAENCLVASASKDGRQLIGVILKSPGREIYNDMQDLLDYGFTQYKNSIYKPAGTVISTITVNGNPDNLRLDDPIYITQKRNGESPNLTLRVVPSNVSPLTKVEEGQVVAHVEVWDGSTLLNTYPLKSVRTISPTAPKKMTDSVLSWISGLAFVGAIMIFILGKKRKSVKRWLNKRQLVRRRESNS